MEKKLPKNWVGVDLESIVVKMTNGTNLTQHENYFENSYPITRIETIANEAINLEKVKYVEADENEINKYRLLKGDILFSHINSDKHLGKTAIYNSDDIIIHGINLLLIRTSKFYNPFLLNYFLKYYRFEGKFMDVAQRAVNQSSINQKKLNLFGFPLPPIPEQNRIVTKLDTLFAQLETIKSSMANIPLLLKDFRQQVLTQAITGKLTEEWRKGKELDDVEKYILRIKKKQEKELIEQQELNLKLGLKKTSKRDNKILPDSEIKLNIPDCWRVSRIADVIYDLTDYHANGSYVDLKANVTLKEEPDYACMIRSTNFEKNNFDSLMIYINEHAYNYMDRSKLFGNEILISKIGNAGSVYLMPFLNRPASLAMNLFAIRIESEIIAKYIYFHLLSDFSTNNILKYVRGVATKSIDKISVRSLMLGLPSHKEQQEIVSRVESLFAKADAIEKQYEALKAKIDNLPQAILHKAFKGELTEQLESDGDARELLKEIEALKLKTAKAVKGKSVKVAAEKNKGISEKKIKEFK